MKRVKLLSMQQIDPETLKAKIDKNQAPFMLDVRTPKNGISVELKVAC